MDAYKLKNKLEKFFKVEFRVLEKENGNDTCLGIFENDEGFHVQSEIISNNIFILKGEPQQLGANFLRMINSSNKQKRANFISLLRKNEDNVKILINNKKIKLDSFLDNEDEWNSFEIIYQEIPFDKNDEEQYAEVIKLFISAFLSLIDYSIEGFEDGNKIEDKTTRYERNPVNRQICLNHKGYKCAICGFDFEKFYGQIGKGKIEVHHIKPLNETDESYVVDPINDLIPVCSNCHTIIHAKKPAYTPEELVKMIGDKK